MEKRGRLPNLSTFAFTATPKPKTLELFGTQARRRQVRALPASTACARRSRRVHPRRAGELHHLQGLLAAAEEDRGRPALRQEKASTCSSRSSSCTTHAIGEKVAIMVEHFAEGAGRDRRQGQGDDRHPLAPACRSLQARGRQVPRRAAAIPFKALVAFSGR